MNYRTFTWRYLSVGLMGTLMGAMSANAADSAADDLKTRGPSGTVKIAPEPGSATTKPAVMSSQSSEKPLNFTVNYVYRQGGRGPLKPLVENSVLHSGDHYKIQFTPAEDSYIYIFQVDSSKAIYRLFPMTEFGGVTVNNQNPARAGTTYHLPAKDKSFQLDQKVGSETIIFLAFRQPDKALEEQYETLIRSRLNKDSAKVASVQSAMQSSFKTRGLAGIVDDPGKKTASVPWTSAESFTVPVQHLNNLCADCISMITFKHQ